MVTLITLRRYTSRPSMRAVVKYSRQFLARQKYNTCSLVSFWYDKKIRDDFTAVRDNEKRLSWERIWRNVFYFVIPSFVLSSCFSATFSLIWSGPEPALQIIIFPIPPPRRLVSVELCKLIKKPGLAIQSCKPAPLECAFNAVYVLVDQYISSGVFIYI